MEKGKIVVLNGVPSSGKTTLSKVLQARFPDQFFLLPVDILNDISPQKNSLSYNVRFTADPKPVMSAIFGCVKVFSDNGLNVIVDAAFNDIHYPFDTFLNIFPDCDYAVSMVHVTCPLDELRRREKERGDRKIGSSESFLTHLDPQDKYDLTVETFNETLEGCADRIIALMENTEKLTTFKTLWLQRRKQE
jgi:chloramphenicol 3-O phosphotransferase